MTNQTPDQPVPSVTPTNTVQNWLMISLYLLSLAVSVFYASTLDDLFSDQAAMYNPSPVAALMTPTYYLQALVGMLVYPATIVLAYFDSRELRRRGVASPFHWAFSFISILVYQIGRTIVARRSTGSGAAPMIVTLAVWLGGVVLTVAFVLDFLYQAMPGLRG